MLDDVLGGFIGGLLGGRLSRRMSDRSADRLQSEGAVRSGLRILDGIVPGERLCAEWRHGTARLAPGLIQLDGISVQVRAVDATAIRQPTFRETWSSVDPDSRIVRVQTESATLEWAIPERQFDWAIHEATPG